MRTSGVHGDCGVIEVCQRAGLTASRLIGANVIDPREQTLIIITKHHGSLHAAYIRH